MGSLPEETVPLLVEQLREQMNNLSAAVQLLAPAVRERGGPRDEEHLAILNQSLYRMIRMLSNVEFAQLPEGEPRLRRTGLDLAGLCRDLCGQVRELSGKAGVRFSYEEEQATLLSTGDAALLRRMLLNLASNAVRAAGEGGQAGLRLSGTRERAVLTVWDNGPGLSLPGEEGERALLRRPDGLGLGLAVARRIARLHGGTLVLEQREDRGLRAVVSLPVCRPEADAVLRTPRMGFDAAGGFSAPLLELADVLPFRAFYAQELE